MNRLLNFTSMQPLATKSTTAAGRCCYPALLVPARGKYVRQPSPQWDPVHEDINAHVKKRIPGETRVDRVRRFAREWRNVELELGVYKDSRGREIKYRKTFVYRYTYPNAFDEFWWPCK
uniref:Uncharacterized protein n=1 Tax=Trypanosoma congolense (strain IL3000) TaxID=1068625 RepID=G0URK1_TRYCI|nr:conserved hypothetical protein [Trypanosoma congolense IL3000]